MTNTETNKAVIYCRVATPTIPARADSIEGQERRCREYAQAKGYTVTQIFQDMGSGISAERSAMTAMLKFLEAHKYEKLRVLITEPQRLARNIEAQMQFLSKIRDAGGQVEIVSPRFLETKKSRSADKSAERERER